jgi:hypothetical protein
VFWVISVYVNIRKTPPKSGTFLMGHPVYIYIYIYIYIFKNSQVLLLSVKQFCEVATSIWGGGECPFRASPIIQAIVTIVLSFISVLSGQLREVAFGYATAAFFENQISSLITVHFDAA